jgi:catechol 2,3-dioxygenase-like lactoylglutathione lyase family enzyme
MLNGISTFFVVDDLDATIEFYRTRLGFSVLHKGGGDGDEGADFWAMVGRDRVMMMFKCITPEIHPQPNHTRHEYARWDAYIHTDEPDALYAELVGRGAAMHRELADTNDGLRAFEIKDNSGYVLCFGRPIER